MKTEIFQLNSVWWYFFPFQWGQKVVQKHESESSKYRIKTFQVGQVKYSTVDLKEDYLKLQIFYSNIIKYFLWQLEKYILIYAVSLLDNSCTGGYGILHVYESTVI